MITDADFLIDIDRKTDNLSELAEEFANRMTFMHFFTPFRFSKIEILETSNGFHFYLWSYSQRPSAIQAVLIQLALGSDYKREIFNYKRVWSKKTPPRWNILFRSKYNDEGKCVSREVKSDRAIRLEEEIMTLYTVKTEKKKRSDE